MVVGLIIIIALGIGKTSGVPVAQQFSMTQTSFPPNLSSSRRLPTFEADYNKTLNEINSGVSSDLRTFINEPKQPELAQPGTQKYSVNLNGAKMYFLMLVGAPKTHLL